MHRRGGTVTAEEWLRSEARQGCAQHVHCTYQKTWLPYFYALSERILIEPPGQETMVGCHRA